MKSIDKLREIASRLDDAAANVSEHGFSPIAIKTSLLCDEIEAEITDNYMRLPVDADGVPWTLETESFIDDTGRTVKFSGLQVDCKGRWKILSNCVWHDPSLCRHVKPRTLEDVIEGAINAAFGNEASPSDIAKKSADEIREMLGIMLGGEAE